MGTRLPRGLRVPLLVLFVAALGALVGGGAIHADSECAVPPNNLTAALNADGSAIVLNWEASGDCVPDTYAVYRRVMADEPKVTKFADVDGQSLSYTDTAIAAGKTYRYRIRSNDQGGRTAVADVSVPEAQPEPEPEAKQEPLTESNQTPTRNTVLRSSHSYVSNIDQARDASSLGIGGFDQAQDFTTGAASGGYTLHSIEVKIDNSGPSQSGNTVPTMTLHKSSPTSTAVATLTTTDTLPQNGVADVLYTAPANTTLDASSTYYIVLKDTLVFVQTGRTTSDDEDDGAATGWSIGDTGGWRTAGSSGAFTDHISSAALMISVNQSTPPDTTAPALATTDPATVDGATLVLTYDEALNGDSEPAASAYTVNVNSSSVTVSSVDVDGMTVTLTLAAAVVSSDTVTVSYAVPGTNPVEDSAGNDAAAFSDQAVTNNTADTTAPAFVRATIDGVTLTVRYDEALKETPLPATGDFTVTVDGSDVTPSTVSISGKDVTLTLDAGDTASRGDTVLLNYTSGANPVEDAAGNDVADLSAQAVDNLTLSDAKVTFVANHDATTDMNRRVGNTNGGDNRLAQKLTTGNAQGGYSLESVTIDVSSAAANARPQVTIRDGDAADPGAVLVTLLPPLNFGNGLQTFTAPPDTLLDANTDYFVAVNNLNTATTSDARFDIALTVDDAEDSGNQAGWSIDDSSLRFLFNSWQVDDSVQIELSGLVKDDDVAPALASTDPATVDGATLVLTYDEALNGASDPAASAYTVSVDSSSVTVSSVDVDGMTVTLTLAAAVSHSDTVTVSYAVPGTNPVEDTSGNEADAFTDQAVTNRTPPRIYVSNIDQSNDGAGLSLSSFDQAQGFTTGSQTGGYALYGIEIKLENGSPSTLSGNGLGTVTVHKSTPTGTLVATLTASGSLAGNATADVLFTAPADTRLEASTTYHVVIEDATFLNSVQTTSDAEDSGAASGWSIEDNSSRRSSGTSVAFETQADALMISVNGQPPPAVPMLTGAAVDGASLVLTYDIALDENSNPALTAYTVKVNDTAVTISTVDVSGSAVTLTLASAVSDGDSVTVSYTVPDSNPVQGADGASAAALTDEVVTNNTDTIAPVFMRATVDEDELNLRYDEDLDTSSEPAVGDYTVTVAGATVAVSDVSISGSIVTLALASEAEYGEATTFSYVVPGSNALQDPAGNQAAALTDQVADNRTIQDGQVELVSNIRQRRTTTLRIVVNPEGRDSRVGQGFTTGSYPDGYDLQNLYIHINNAGLASDPLITIRERSSSDRFGGELIYTLVNPLVTGTGWVRFSAPVGSVLEPNRRYTVRFENNSTSAYTPWSTTRTGEDSQGLSDWSIDNNAGVCLFGGGCGIWTGGGDAAMMRMRLTGFRQPDMTSPELSTAIVQGASLVLTYNEDLDTASQPAGSAFTVTSSGTAVTVDSVSVSGRTVTLTLATAVADSDTVLLSYAVPTTDPIQDVAGNDAAALTSESVETANSPPVFNSGLAATLSVAENTASGTDIGDPYTATDADSDTLAYSLAGTDSAEFTITPTGQIQTEEPLNFENKSSYSVMVQVSDGKNAAGETDDTADLMMAVTITVTDVNDEPVFTSGPTTITTPEGTATSVDLGSYVVHDPDIPNGLLATAGGPDGTQFNLGTRGRTGADSRFALRANVVFDFENPVDQGGDNSYAVTLRVNDQGHVTEVDDSRNVTITVTDVEEPETLTLPTPVVRGQSVTASVSGDTTSNETWQWASANSPTGTFTDITGANAASYTPVDGDVGKYLRVSLSYDDTHAMGMSISATSTVVKRGNSNPTFAASTVTRSVNEHTGRDTAAKPVGAAVTATDADDDPLHYRISGTDAGSFTVNAGTGQISTSGHLSFETKSSYTLTLHVRDNRDDLGDSDMLEDATTTVDITLNNLDEAGVVTITGGASAIGGTQLSAAVTDPDGISGTPTWRWARADTAGGTYTNISGASSASYTPVAADVGKFLRATASYTDGHGSGKSASSATAQVRSNNNEPTFSSATTARSLAENTTTVVNVGDAVTASDADSDATLTYALTGTDASSFSIDTTTGQIKTRAGQTFDFESAKKSYAVTVTVQDGIDAAGSPDTAEDARITVTISLTDVNEDPTITTTDTTASIGENSTEVLTLAAADVDTDTGNTLTWSIDMGTDAPNADRARFTINATTGALSFSAAPNFESPADADANNEYLVRVKVTDNGIAGNRGSANHRSDTHDLKITVNNVNEAPVITSPPATESFAENATGTVVDFDATDVDANTTLTWSVESAADGGKFAINATTGELRFANPPNYEMPTDVGDTAGNNTYVVTVKVTDNGTPQASASHSITVTVTNVNDAPVITTTGAAYTAPSVDENTPASTVVATYEATDMDAGASLTWAKSGTDHGDFTITTTSDGRGELRFASASNYEDSTDNDNDNEYELTLTVSDNHLPQMSDTINVTVTVNDVNETPIVTADGGDATPDFAEIHFDDESVTADDLQIDLFSAVDEEDDTITWSLSGDDSDHFEIETNEDGKGVLRFKAFTPNTMNTPANFEQPVDTGSDNTYAVTVRATDDNAQGGKTGVKTGTFDLVVTVRNENETPVIISGPMTVSFEEITWDAERMAADLALGGYTAYDEEGDTITWSLPNVPGGTDRADFAIDPSTGELSFRHYPNFEDPQDGDTDNEFEFIVRATDTGSNSRDASVTITVTNVDERPEFTNPPADPAIAEIEYDSGETVSSINDVAVFTIRDEEDEDISWSFVNDADTDYARFSITENGDGAGVVRFRSVPDFENPQAIGDDGNHYHFTVQATDEADPTARVSTHSFSVRVTDVNERPAFVGTPTAAVSYDENDTSDVADYVATDQEGGVTWSLSGADRGFFEIDSGGAVRFKETPSYEDRLNDNTYEFNVVATDILSAAPRRSAEQAVVVTVNDLEEPGAVSVNNATPAVGNWITFTLTDPDGGISTTPGDMIWRVHAGSTRRNIVSPSATTLGYRVVEDDTGHALRAEVDYCDRRNGDCELLERKTAMSASTDAVTADPRPNVKPILRSGTQFDVDEGESGRVVGTVVATDRDNDPLTYGVTNTDFFEIDPSSGVIRLIQAPDFEDIATGFLHFTITVHDGKGLDASNMVISDDAIDISESASVRVVDLEEDGVVTLSDVDPGVGESITATLLDDDGNISGAVWQWARSVNGRSGWIVITGQTTNRYTTAQADANFYLRARVAYDDRRGGGKVAEAVTEAPVAGENQRPTFPDTETGQRTIAENTPSGVDIGEPVAASDPETDRLSYSLRGPHASHFGINSSNGQLRTSAALDFETLATYQVTVEVHDGKDANGDASTAVDDTQSVTISVENVDEPGTVALASDTGEIQARVEITATLTDDDGPHDPEWQWWRSPNGRTDWVRIAGATDSTYTPTADVDQGNYLRARASYEDPHSEFQSASQVSGRVGAPPPVNSRPVFPASETGRREIPENSSADSNIGDPIAATDVNAGDPAVNDPLVYALSGADAASFEIDEGTGQLTLAQNTTLDFESKRIYRVTVTVHDGTDAGGLPDPTIDASLPVEVHVTDVNEAPVISGEASVSVQENLHGKVTTIQAVDPERDALTWSVDRERFWISSRGDLYFSTPPNFEADQGPFPVDVTVSDGTSETAPFRVTVSVTDAEEAGAVTIAPPRAWEGTRLSAGLSDPDGDISNPSWQWSRSSNGSSWSEIANADTSSYTTRPDDVGQYLRASVAYSDRRGANKHASAVLSRPVLAADERPSANGAPVFDEGAGPVSRSVAQGPSAGRPVGAPVRASDPDVGDILTYSLSGADAAAFAINPASGQILTRAVLDPARDDEYRVSVSVSDGFDGGYQPLDAEDALIEVVITVTEVSEPVSAPATAPGGGGGGGAPAVARPSEADFDWNVTRDIDSLLPDNDSPTGLWADGQIIWVLDNAPSGSDRLFAYDLNSGEPKSDRDLALHSRNRFAHGLWADGQTLWVADSGRDRLFVYELDSGERQEDREFDLHEDNRDPRGIWADGQTIYVLDSGQNALFAYDLDTGAFLAQYPLDPLNRSPRGLWSDGLTIWVSDDGAKRIFAYRLVDAALQRIEAEEFSFRSLLKAGNSDARGIWADGGIMYVVDQQDDKVYSYNLPDAIDARLGALALSDVEFGPFSALTSDYRGVSSAAVTTVSASPMQTEASLAIAPADDDAETDGHQVELGDQTVITLTVTSADGSRSRVYRVAVEPDNQAPLAAEIAPLSLTVGGPPARLDLSAFFSDPERDPLSFTVGDSSDAQVATVTAVGGVVTITPISPGTASFEASARDAARSSETRTVQVTVEPAPAVAELRIVARRHADDRTEFAVQLRDDDGNWGDRILPRLRYLPETAQTGRWFVSNAMTILDGEFNVRIAARNVSAGRVEFALQLRDSDGDWSQRQQPRLRFLPASATIGRWLHSSPLELGRDQ